MFYLPISFRSPPYTMEQREEKPISSTRPAPVAERGNMYSARKEPIPVKARSSSTPSPRSSTSRPPAPAQAASQVLQRRVRKPGGHGTAILAGLAVGVATIQLYYAGFMDALSYAFALIFVLMVAMILRQSSRILAFILAMILGLMVGLALHP